MDPPPLPPHSITISEPTVITATATNHPNSTDSSPRSRHIDTWDEPLPLVPGAKLRLMCSYGGHIIPRPHDKSLCYIGGHTRVVVVDRHSSLSALSSRLSRTLLHGRHFTLKYQLPNEDLDSLVSVTTDEDLENMIDEYDRTTLKPSRLRLFLFLAKPETAASMGSLLDDAKSESWFVDALNGAGLLPRGLSDSAVADGLIEFGGIVNSDSCTDLEAQIEDPGGNKQVKNMADWAMAETNSSFGSSSSSPSMSNLSPIKVRVEDVGSGLQGQMVGFVMLSDPPLGGPAAVPGRVFSDDERSDQGPPCGFGKPPLPVPLQPVQRKFGDGCSLHSPDSKHGGGHNLPSPDSVASDSSTASATSLSKHTFFHDPTLATTRESRDPGGIINPSNNISDPSPQIQMQQAQDSMYMPPPPQQNQQQLFHASTHYIHQPGTGPVPISSYYPVYASPSQQSFHQQTEQQYPMYFLPVTQAHPYNMTMQSNIADATTMASSQPLNPQNTATVGSSGAYKETSPPLYPPRTATPTKPEMVANVYRPPATITPSLVQVPSSQYQQQYVNLSHMPYQTQSTAAANYGFEYAHPTHDQVYYTQHPVAPMPPQYQTMTSAAAGLFSQAPAQQPADNTKPQNKPSQPL